MALLWEEQARRSFARAAWSFSGWDRAPTPTASLVSPKRSAANLRNPGTGWWFCAKCGRTSERMVKDDAQAELEKYECNLPAVNPTQVDRK